MNINLIKSLTIVLFFGLFVTHNPILTKSAETGTPNTDSMTQEQKSALGSLLEKQKQNSQSQNNQQAQPQENSNTQNQATTQNPVAENQDNETKSASTKIPFWMMLFYFVSFLLLWIFLFLGSMAAWHWIKISSMSTTQIKNSDHKNRIIN